MPEKQVTLVFPDTSGRFPPFDEERSIYSLRLFGSAFATLLATWWNKEVKIGGIQLEDERLFNDSKILDELQVIAPVRNHTEGPRIIATNFPKGVGNRERLEAAMDVVSLLSLFAPTASHIADTAIIEDGVRISGPVTIAEGARINAGAVLRGPLYIGRRAFVGNYALVRENTSIGDDAIVGYSTDVKNTVVDDGTWLGPHSAFPDCLIGKDCFFGGGVRVGNMRLDKTPVTSIIDGIVQRTDRTRLGMICGDNVQIGLLSGVLPGRILRNKTMLFPGTIFTGQYSS